MKIACFSLSTAAGCRGSPILGSQGFRHPLRLPLPDFEFRRAGTPAARLLAGILREVIA